MLSTRLGGSLFFLALAATVPAQTVPPANSQQPAVATPADPAQRLEVGRRLNGLAVPDAKPWHLKATYQILNGTSKPIETGTFEEWWFSAKQYKVAYSSPSFAQQEFGTDHGIFRTGETRWPAWPLSRMRATIESPVPSSSYLQGRGIHDLKRKFGPDNLACSAVSREHEKNVDEDSESYCFDPATAVLRYSNSLGRSNQIVFDRLVDFHGTFVAQSIRFLILRSDVLALHVDVLETLAPEDAATALPPPGAQPGPRRILEFSATNEPKSIHLQEPEYSSMARVERLSGAVNLILHVGQDGHVLDARVISGPMELRQNCVTAARQALFKPLVMDGEPVEFELPFENNFRMSN